MNSIEKVKTIQEIFLNSWPAKEYYFLNGWILRLNEGITDRANAVIPLRYTGKNLDEDISKVETIYEERSINPSFMVHDHYEPRNLKTSLISRGYHIITPTIVMSVPIQEIVFPKIDIKYKYSFNNKRENYFANFISKFTHWSKQEQEVITKLTNRINIPNKIFVEVQLNRDIIGTMMGVIERNKYIYIADVLVHPKYRNERIATTMLYKMLEELGYDKGAQIIWLQVEEDNKKAINLYKKLGMKPLFHYSYLKKYS